ncbi:MAG: hypothetical protein IJQ37_07680 [Clostridia bacterium]|nr:hypothetical protein [Clostridia bacterium]
MKKTRTLNIASLLFNVTIVYFTASAFIYNFRTDIIRDASWFGISGWSSLRYFTVLSNLFVAAAALVFAVYNVKCAISDEVKYPKWLILIKFTSTVSVTVTLMTVVLFLGPMFVVNGHSYFSLFDGNNLFMHLITPVMAIVTFLFFEGMPQIKFKYTFLAIVPTALYSVLYFLKVIVFEQWPDFYGFSFGGKIWAVPISALSMLTVSFAFGVAEWAIAKRAGKKQQ